MYRAYRFIRSPDNTIIERAGKQMIHTIKNQELEIGVNSLGAELSRIRSLETGVEYLWQGDPVWWDGQSPVLFPIVGALEDDTLKIGADTYNMKQHGFARTSEFELVDSAALADRPSLIYRLTPNAEIKKQYPYDFEFKVSYMLEENSLVNRFEVVNTDTDTIYFSLGGHPGFNAPLRPDESMKDYVFEFEKPESIHRRMLVDRLLDESTEPFLDNAREVPITPALFDKSAIILDGFQSGSVTLKSRKSKTAVRVEFPGFPYLGIWAKPGGAPFVCIEPWYGIASTRGKKPDFREKEGAMALSPGKTFQCQFKITIIG
jgi:galactose mutarotase-like enzyme